MNFLMCVERESTPSFYKVTRLVMAVTSMRIRHNRHGGFTKEWHASVGGEALQGQFGRTGSSADLPQTPLTTAIGREASKWALRLIVGGPCWVVVVWSFVDPLVHVLPTWRFLIGPSCVSSPCWVCFLLLYCSISYMQINSKDMLNYIILIKEVCKKC
jgi:hypothetical protein